MGIGCNTFLFVGLLFAAPFGIVGIDITIIGAGIGGASAAYYLTHLDAPSANTTLHVYERRDYVGGRLKHTIIGGETVELGGDAWSSANEYIIELVKAMGLLNSSVSDTPPSRRVGDPISSNFAVWTGANFANLDKILLGHPLSDVLGAAEELRFLTALRNNYRQRADAPFCTVSEFLAVGHLDEYTSVSSAQYLTAKHVAADTQTEIAEPLMRVIYDQGLEAHAFATLVAFTSVVGSGSVSSGNSVLVEALLKSSGAEVSLNTSVTSVIADSAGGFWVESERGGVRSQAHTDRIILACPFEFLDVRFVNISFKQPIVPRPFVHWYVTIVRAVGVDPTYFGLPSGAKVAENILTDKNATAAGTPFSVLQLEASFSPTDNLYKLFSNDDLAGVIPRLFLNVSQVVTQVWPFTFPELQPKPIASDAYQPIVLTDGLFYLNTLESVASAMEGSVIAARNVALLLRQGSTDTSTPCA